MKTYISKIFLLGAALVVPFSSCDTDGLHDLNVNPQAILEIDMNYLFTAAQLGAAAAGSSGDNRYIDWRTNIGLTAYAIQQLATASGGISPGDKYTDNVETYNAPWEFIYGDQLKNIAEILVQTGPGGFAEGTKKNTREASRILRAFLFHRLTDYYGNIPYTEAARGLEGINEGKQGILFPKYDPQEIIYKDLLKELAEASAAISASNPDDGFAAADLYFGGDIDKWKKWGYSLMLRLALRISNVDLATASTYVSQAIAGGVMTSNDDNVWVPMSDGPSEWTNQNGISRAFSPGDGGQPTTLSKRLVDELKGPNAASTADDDPRLMILSNGISCCTGAGGAVVVNRDPLAQIGMPNGWDTGDLTDAYPDSSQNKIFSAINTKLIQDSDPYMLMNYAEVEFLQAEAIIRNIGTGITGTAEEHFNAGVKAAMQMFEPYQPGDNSLVVSDADVNTYLSAPGRGFPTGGSEDEQMEAIYTQMWIAKFFNWWDAWADWRRTGYPTLVPVNYPGNVTNGTIPRKLRLPTHEHAVNATNIQSGATLPDEPTTRVWWDVD